MFRVAGIAAGLIFALFYLTKRYIRKFARTLDSAKDPESISKNDDI